MEHSFNPADFHFSWTPPEDPTNPHDHGWYSWDRKAAHAAALRARNARAKELRKQGKRVYCSSQGNNLITRGGIGSGHAEISMVVTVYTIHTIG